jgi:hypothetical protein
MPQPLPVIRIVVGKVQDRRFAARAGNAAGIASYLVLTGIGRRSLAGPVVPALIVRRHVRRAFMQFSDRRGGRKRVRAVASAGAIIALAVGGSARRRRASGSGPGPASP